MKKQRVVRMLFVLGFVLFSIACFANASTDNIDKAFSDIVPDYYHWSTAYGGLPNGGSGYCAPGAASDYLMWYDKNGFDNLVTNTTDPAYDQFTLIETLGSAAYMATNIDQSGTNETDLLNGLKKYIHDKGYTYSRLNVQGMWTYPAEFDTGIRVPDINAIKNGTKGFGSVWLSVRFYNFNAARGEYDYQSAHVIAVIGYGYDGASKNPNSLIVHDSNTNTFNDYLPYEIMPSATLHIDNYIMDATGQIRLHNIQTQYDLALVDSAFFMSMKPPVNGCCTATITSNDLKLHIPVLNYNNGTLYAWFELQYQKVYNNALYFNFTDFGQASPEGMTNCYIPTMSANFTIHLPSLYLGNTSYWVDLQYVPSSDGLIWFATTNVGVN